MSAVSLPVSPKSLDTTKRGGAVKLEARYMEQWLPYQKLRAKYRKPMGAYSQHGCGGDHAGKAQQKGGAKTAKGKTVVKPRIMFVNGATGKSRMIDG